MKCFKRRGTIYIYTINIYIYCGPATIVLMALALTVYCVVSLA